MLNKLLTRGFRRLDFSGKAQFLEHTCPKEGNLVADIFGYRVKLNLADSVQRRIYCGTYKSDQYDMLNRYIRRGMTFVDVGANIGYYTLLFASFEQEYPRDGSFDQDYLGNPGRVYAFEPGPLASERLVETISYNDLLNVHFQPVALGDAAGERPLYVSRRPNDSRCSMLPFADSVPVEVPIKRLDDALKEQGVLKVDLLRLDVNGYEPNVLAGASEYLKERRIAAILCAFDEDRLKENGSNRAALYDLLVSYGFGFTASRMALDRGAKSVLMTLNS